ncbi:MarR family winged helix-turn-helix transcriptional regulator [Streptomyces jeddahensis]|uniref:MarR family protein n=1 Tax=Streptomyces jeddahensis TaxID=1716141 RepID=A0A177HNI3_9ACTN|nr:MarR family winged helix-turn-helix transcriptional regulator [Streptomyces jeddahensis]OAH12160.1 MarR family protein [Streptomyces jeddahensis]
MSDVSDVSEESLARETASQAIAREVIALTRRARAAAAQLHPELSLVTHTILTHVSDQRGCNATDLAAHYMLDKSTVSRQVSALLRMGLLARRPDPRDHRAQILEVTEAGYSALAAAARSRQAMFDDRLGDWGTSDLVRFAAYLERYNRTLPRGGRPAAGDTVA